jgi:regulator of protease activity HflC (stomatin/prohibitin superfamily)
MANVRRYLVEIVVVLGLIALGVYNMSLTVKVVIPLFVGFLIILAWIWFLAKGNSMFTFVREGSAKAIMHGDGFHHFVMRFRNYHLNDPRKPWFDPSIPEWQVIFHGRPDGEINHDDPKFHDRSYDDRHWLLRALNVYWVGIPPIYRVNRYRFRWNEIVVGDDGKEKLYPRNEMTDFIFVQDFTYAIVADNAHTSQGVPIEAVHLDTLAVRNPHRALFIVDNWLLRVGSATSREARNYIGKRTYRQLLSETDETDPSAIQADSFSAPICKLNKVLPDIEEPPYGLEGRYGVKIRTSDLKSINLPEGAEDVGKATTAEFIAIENARALKVSSEAEATAELVTGKAKADVITLTGKAHAKALDARLKVILKAGNTGELLAQLDAMSADGPNKTVIWANNPFVRSQNGLADLLNGAGITTPDALREFLASMSGKVGPGASQ